MLNKNPSCR